MSFLSEQKSTEVTLGDELRKKRQEQKEAQAAKAQLDLHRIWNEVKIRVKNATPEEVDDAKIKLTLGIIHPITRSDDPLIVELATLCEGQGLMLTWDIYHGCDQRTGCDCTELSGMYLTF